MRLSIARRVRFLTFTTFVALFGGQSAQAGHAHLILHSDPGSYIGGGKSYDITDDAAAAYTLYTGYNLPDGELTYVTFSVFQSGTVNAEVTFSTHLLGIALQTGVYTDAQRFPFETSGHPGLDVTFYDEGSNTLTGSFTITDATFYKDAKGVYQVATFAATFDQLSEPTAPTHSHVFGSITYAAAVPEPSSIVLCGAAGLVGLGVARARRRGA